MFLKYNSYSQIVFSLGETYSANKDVAGEILSPKCLILWHRLRERRQIFFEILFKQISPTIPPTSPGSDLLDAAQG